MNHRLLGWSDEQPRLRLDHRAFAYAGKFVTGTLGVAVTTDSEADAPAETDVEPATAPPDRSFLDPPNPVVAVVGFSPDRTADDVLWLRYVTVRRDRHGETLAGRLCSFVCRRGATRGYETVRIAVNNPAAYDALAKAGFGFTGRETGVAELVMARSADEPVSPDPTTYRDGLAVFRTRDLPDAQAATLERAMERGPPERVD